MDKQIIASDVVPAAVGPYSQAVRAGDFIFCSGMLGISLETGEIVDESFEAQVRQVLDNITALLNDCGTSTDAVVKATVFLVDMADFPLFNPIYAEYFPANPPARSTIQVGPLPLGARIEVEVIALA